MIDVFNTINNKHTATNYRLLSEQVQNQVKPLFKMHNKPELVYHKLAHSENVAIATTQIANHYQLNDRDFFIVTAAAWFHDVGYFEKATGHEEISAQQAATFLTNLQVSNTDITAVRQCILATKLPQAPNNLLEQIVCDADFFHFGTDAFSENNKLMRKEYNALNGDDISKEDWRQKTIELMQNHHYYTDYCRILLDAKKQENLHVLLVKQQKEAPTIGLKPFVTVFKPGKDIQKPSGENADMGKEKPDRPGRGIETMFRISSSNHQRLSDMADNKSQIIITVNSIIISVVVSLLLRKLDTNDYLTIPAMMLLLVSLVAIVLSILATRPHIPGGTFTPADLHNKNVNLLFFGNFYRMSIENYTEGMHKVMEDRDFLYDTLIRDIYAQGVVLGRKYKLLRASYNVFMYGLIASVIAFIIASFQTAPV